MELTNDEKIERSKKIIIFKGWVAAPPPANPPKDLEDNGITNFHFVNEYCKNGQIDKMKDMIDNYPWTLSAWTMDLAMNEALKSGQWAAISLLLEYVEILDSGYLKWFLDNFSAEHFKALDMLRLQRPEFLEQIYDIKDDVDEKVYIKVMQYLDSAHTKEVLNKGVPVSGNVSSASVPKI